MEHAHTLKSKIGNFIIDQLGLGLFRYDMQQGSFEYVNDAFGLILGYDDVMDVKPLSFTALFKNRKYCQDLFDRLDKSKTVKRFEAVLKRADGENTWVSISASKVLHQAESDHIFIEGIIEDISTQKAFEEKSGLEHNALKGLLDNLPEAVYFKDAERRLIRVNKFYADGFGMTEDQLVGKTDYDFFPPEQAKRMQEDDDYVLSSGNPIVGKIEKTLLPNGTWNQVVTTKIPLYSVRGRVVGTMGITRDITGYSRIEEEKLRMSVNAIKALSRALEMKDPYTFGHASRVALLAGRLAQEMGWGESEVLGIKLAAQLHDIGKIVVPLEILSKPGKLSALEYQMIQQHVQNCYEILSDIEYPFPLAEAIYQHHERIDGSGYPRGLKGDQIIKEARILAVSDVLEAMTCHRPYRAALGVDAAIEELQKGKGTAYDPEMADLAVWLIKENGGKPFWLEEPTADDLTPIG